MADSQNSIPADTPLIRGIGVGGATMLNMIDMIGVGPFITIPLIISAAGGPQAMLGWIVGALLAICDGLVWAELGAAFPRSGGSYAYLQEIYGSKSLGRLLSFLFIWQLSFSAPLSIASGSIGLSNYAGYLWPSLETTYWAGSFQRTLPGLGPLGARLLVTGGTFVAIATCLLAILLLYRRITGVVRISKWLGGLVLATIAWIIISGLTHFDASRAFSFPPGAFHLSRGFLTGLGASMLIATYDYWGYYNVCFLGDEVKDPGRTIPRALIYSILIVGCLYVVMNISILGVIPWQEMNQGDASHTALYVISIFMQRLYGPWAARLVTVLVMITAFASVFSLFLGYSRVPYAAALDGNYFRAFARVHPRHHFPYVSLLALGTVAMAFCFLRLADVIAALVVIRIMIQFLVQAIGVIVLRVQRPELPRPFRMWLFPVPALLASAGFLYIVISRPNFLKEIRYAVVILIAGVVVYMIRARQKSEWPFARAVLAKES